MSRAPARTIDQILSGGVAGKSECDRVFRPLGHTKKRILEAYEEAAAIERNRPHGSLYPDGEKVELETICKVVRTSIDKEKKAVLP